MKILQISDYYHHGDGHPLNNFCERLRRRGHEVEVYTSNLQALPIPLNDFNSSMKISRFRGISICGKAVYPGAFWGLFTMKNPDVVHSHVVGFFSTFAAACLKPLKRYSLVVTLDFDPAEPEPPLLKRPYTFLYRTLPARMADVLTAFTEEEKREFSRRFNLPLERIKRLPIGIDLEAFSVPPKRDRKVSLGLEGKFLLLNVSFLSPKKNLEMVLRSLQSLPEEAVFLHIGGTVDASYKASLDRLVSDLGLGERVFFLEDAPFEDFPEYYQAADAFVQPGFRESYAIPILEAMASGLPVLATDRGVAPEVVEEGVTGFFIKSDVDLAAKVLRLMDDEALRKEMGARARERVAAYDWEKVIDRLEEIYARAAER